MADYEGGRYWRAMFNAGLCKYFVLQAVCMRPMHGYVVIQWVAERTRHNCVPTDGAVYPILRDFENSGCVTSHDEVVRGRNRRIYTATTKGRKSLEVATRVLTACLSGISKAID